MGWGHCLSKETPKKRKRKTKKTNRNGLPGALHPDPAHQQQVRQGPPAVERVGRQEEVEGEQDDVELDLLFWNLDFFFIFFIFFNEKKRERERDEENEFLLLLSLSVSLFRSSLPLPSPSF